MVFNGFVGFFLGKEPAVTFFTAYLVEASLSVDNLFVFFIIFDFFKIARKHQLRVLFWGVLGAFFFRLIFILLGLTLLQSFEWMSYVFGAILFATAVYLFRSQGLNIKDSWLFALAKKYLPLDEKEHSGNFFVKKKNKVYMTSLFLALLFVEATDLLFAVDSIPAVLAITKDPFIAYTSNVFAVLGLRSFYLCLASWQERLSCLKPAILCILLFIGVKMFISPFYHIPSLICLGVIVLILAAFILLEVSKKKKER